MAEGGIVDWINRNPEKGLRLLKTALLPLIRNKDAISRADHYPQLLQALQHKYPEGNQAFTLMHSALKTIGCPQGLLRDSSYDPTNDENIIQFELMLALILVLHKLPNDKYNGFRLSAMGRFLSHQPVSRETSRRDFIESLYDNGAIDPNNVSVFLRYLDELECQDSKQPLLDFLQRNNIMHHPCDYKVKKKITVASYQKAIIFLALISAVFFAILSIAGVGLFVGYTSDTVPIVNTTYFNDSYTAAPFCYNSFDTKLVQVTTDTLGFSADLFLVSEPDIAYDTYTLPEKKLRSLTDNNIEISIAFGYPGLDEHKPLYSNIIPGIISYRINLQSSSQSSCHMKVFLYDLKASYEDKLINFSPSSDGSIGSSDCLDVGDSTVNLTLIPNKPILVAAYTDKYEVLDAYAMVELTQVNTSLLSPSCTISSTQPCNINLGRYPVRKTRKCILITSHGEGSVSLTSVPVSLNGVRLIGISSIAVFGSIAAVLIFLVVFVCVKRRMNRR